MSEHTFPIFVFRIVKRLIISAIAALTTTISFGQCGTTGNTITVESAEDLLDIAPCDTIWGSLVISDWDASDLDELENLVYVEENLILDENISLININGLESLTHVGGNLEFRNNFTLQHISGLNSLEFVGGSLIFFGNITLVDITEIEVLNEIHGDLIISENHTLENLDGLINLSQIEGDFILDAENVILNDLAGLGSLENIGGDFYCALPDATTIDGLEALSTVDGNVLIEFMENVANLNGLGGLTNVGGDLTIRENNNLVDCDALAAISMIGGDLEIHDNNVLFLCCGLKPVIEDGAVQGSITIEENGNGCSSVQEIVDDCIDESLESIDVEFFFVEDETGFKISSYQELEIVVVNVVGQELGRCTAGQKFDTADLRHGIYLLKISNGNSTVVKKYIKRR